MDSATKRRLQAVMEASKRGHYVSDADSEFATQCWKKWPDEYSDLHKEVVERVTRSMMNPFGGGR